jgi:LL-diaminopimelate aminotransferase
MGTSLVQLYLWRKQAMMKIEKSDRINSLPPYLFKEIDRQKEEVKKRGIDIIDLGVGDPDMPTPGHIIEALNKA